MEPREPGKITTVCFDGIESEYCNIRAPALFSQTERVIEAISDIISEGKVALIVASSFIGVSRLLESVEQEGLNPFLLEFAAITESILSGLSIDQIILYHYGVALLTLDERLSATRVKPAVSRRELLRRAFLIPERYVIPPRISKRCEDEVCPYAAIEGKDLNLAKCRGCMYCVTRFECGPLPKWSSVDVFAYVYSFASEHSIDGLVVTCRRQLDSVTYHVTEATPAKLLLLAVPCISWLDARLLKRLIERLDLPVYVYLDESVCSECWLSKVARQAVEWLRDSGIPVVSELVEAAEAAGRGYSRRGVEPERVAEILSEEARE